MIELLKLLQKIEERINYLIQIKDFTNWGNLFEFQETCVPDGDPQAERIHRFS